MIICAIINANHYSIYTQAMIRSPDKLDNFFF